MSWLGLPVDLRDGWDNRIQYAISRTLGRRVDDQASAQLWDVRQSSRDLSRGALNVWRNLETTLQDSHLCAD